MPRSLPLLTLLIGLTGWSRPAPDCTGLLGDWNWSIGAVLTFRADRGVTVNGVASGRWECLDARRGRVLVRWTNGFVDSMTFTANRGESVNQIGFRSSGTRRAQPPGGAANAAPAAPAAGRSDGAVRLVSASPILQRCIGVVPGGGRIVAAQRDAAACRQLPGSGDFDEAGRRFRAGDHAGAAALLRRAAEAGNPVGQLRLAMLLETGDGVQRDPKAAVSWYTRAANQGEPASQTELGYYYEEADGVPESWDLAARLYEASARQGWVKGQFALGRAYEFGIGVPQNRSEAIAWFRRATTQGDAQGRYYAEWLSDPSNSIGFRSDAEHDLVIAGRLRFALGPGDPAGITFHASAQRAAWLRQERSEVDASEPLAHWQLQRDAYDSCRRRHDDNCHDPGPRPRR